MRGTFYHMEEIPGGVRLWVGGGGREEVEYLPYVLVPEGAEVPARFRDKILSEEEVVLRDPLREKRFRKVRLREEDRRRISREVKGVRAGDIPTWHQFLMERGLEPFSLLSEDLEPVGIGGLEDLKIMYFTGVVYSKLGYPVVGESPIIALAYAVGDEEPVSLEGPEGDDSEIIGEFLKTVRREDPDVIVGYGQDADELAHIQARAERGGVNLDGGRGGGEPRETGRFFRGIILVERVIPGRADLDLFALAWRDFPQLPTRSWHELADALGVERPNPIPKYKIPNMWRGERDRILRYMEDKVDTIREMAKRLLPHQEELSRRCLRPIHETIRSPVGELVESLVLRRALREGMAPPERRRSAGYFKGGFVWLDRPGLYREVGYLDFRSMYPSIIAGYNISPETVSPPGGECPTRRVEGEGTIKEVCTEPRGIISGIAEELIRERAAIKEESSAAGPGEVKKLRAVEKAIKVLTNALYGYMGWGSALFKSREAAELTAAVGRRLIKEVMKRAEEMGLKPIYVDTDGIQLVGGSEGDYLRLAEEIDSEYPLSLEFQYVADAALYLSKKKYAHLVGGRLEARGFEFVRRDYPAVVKKAQRRVVEAALRGAPMEEIVRTVASARKRLERREVDMEDLVIVETVGKRLEDFQRKTKGYAVGMWLKGRGIEIHRGQVLRIVIVKGRGSVNERARPVEFVSPDDVDFGYYLELFDGVMDRTLRAIREVEVGKEGGGGGGLEDFL